MLDLKGGCEFLPDFKLSTEKAKSAVCQLRCSYICSSQFATDRLWHCQLHWRAFCSGFVLAGSVAWTFCCVFYINWAELLPYISGLYREGQPTCSWRVFLLPEVPLRCKPDLLSKLGVALLLLLWLIPGLGFQGYSGWKEPLRVSSLTCPKQGQLRDQISLKQQWCNYKLFCC